MSRVSVEATVPPRAGQLDHVAAPAGGPSDAGSLLDGLLTRRWRYVTLSILAVALLARLPGLNSDVWIDEVYTIINTAQPFGRAVTPTGSGENHILYTLLASLSTALLGPSPIALRLPAVAFGLLTIWATMEFVRLVGSKREALIVGVFSALSYHHVWFSQNARGYIAIMFFVMTASALFYLGWRGHRWVWPCYAVAVALGMLAQPIALVVPATHATILVVDALARGRLWQKAPPGTRRFAWMALVASGVLTALLYAPATAQLARYESTMARGTPDYHSSVFASLLGALTANAVLIPATLVLAIVALIGLFDYGRRDRLVLAMLTVPLAWGIIGAVIMQCPVEPRYFAYLLPLALVIAVHGIEVGSGRWRTWIVAVLIVLSAASLYFCYRYPKQDFSGALAYVRQHARADATVASLSPASVAYANYYAPEITHISSMDHYQKVLSEERETWILITLPRVMRDDPRAVFERVRQDFQHVARFPGTLGDGALDVYHRPARDAST